MWHAMCKLDDTNLYCIRLLIWLGLLCYLTEDVFTVSAAECTSDL